MTTEVVIKRPRPHPGQRAILDNLARFNTLRAGRRYGKSHLYQPPAIDRLVHGFPVGLFVQEYKYLAEVWRDFKNRLKPLIKSCNDSEHRMELVTGGVLEGWTLKNNEDPARSRKYKLVIIDEAGLVKKLRLIWQTAIRPTLIDMEGSAIIVGTSKVQWPDFNWFCRYAESGVDPDWKHFTGRTFDNPHLPKSEVDEIEKQRALMPAWQFAQEYEGAEAEGVSSFFPRATIDKHRAQWQEEPQHSGRIVVRGDPQGSDLDAVLTFKKGECLQWIEDPHGPWKLWCELDQFDRPDPQRRYASGWDLGAGVGSSNTVGSFGDTESRHKIAEYVDSRVPPEAAARIALMACYFFGGVDKCAWIKWESNGGTGEKFGQDLMKLKHPRMLRRKEEGVSDETGLSLEDFGWWSSNDAKEVLLTDYRADLTTDRMVNPSAKALDETLTYHWDKGRLVSIRMDADPIDELARMPHGDRVMGDAILRKAMEQVARLPPPKPPEPPRGSIGDRLKTRLKQINKEKKRGRVGW